MIYTPPSTPVVGTIATYLWDFGDGITATGKTASHTYATEATFTARLQVTDNKGAANTTTIASTNDADTISGRIKNIGLTSFAYAFRKQESKIYNRVKETVHYIAWEPGKGTIGSIQFEAATTVNAVTDAWYTRAFTKSFTQLPLLLAGMQTTNDTDPSALRVQQVSATGFQVRVQEETSKSTDITHAAETVGYLGFDKVEE